VVGRRIETQLELRLARTEEQIRSLADAQRAGA
jgi:hypothetical protein